MMYKKDTAELEQILEHTHPGNIADFVEENEENLLNGKKDFVIYVRERLKEKGLLKQDVFLRADVPLKYGYKILSGERTTGQRDFILRICYGAGFTLSETQEALKLYGMGKLYARDTRDALLMTCFNEHPGSIIDVNEMLLANKLEPLRPSGTQE
ncbi:hypothetical protein QYZ88_010365 [Lachnospiraceae bacterium C1.1]|nr:hypothetical protein [Lachnospiraceae bacterium C1.1]